MDSSSIRRQKSSTSSTAIWYRSEILESRRALRTSVTTCGHAISSKAPSRHRSRSVEAAPDGARTPAIRQSASMTRCNPRSGSRRSRRQPFGCAPWPAVVDDTVRKLVSLLLVEPCLRPDPVDDAQSLAQSFLQHLGIAPARPGGTDSHLSHQPLIDREGRLRLAHAAILPHRRKNGKMANQTIPNARTKRLPAATSSICLARPMRLLSSPWPWCA